VKFKQEAKNRMHLHLESLYVVEEKIKSSNMLEIKPAGDRRQPFLSPAIGAP